MDIFAPAWQLMRYAFRRAALVRVTTPLVRERVLALGATREQIALIPRNIASYCFPPKYPLDTYRLKSARRSLLGNVPDRRIYWSPSDACCPSRDLIFCSARSRKFATMRAIHACSSSAPIAFIRNTVIIKNI